MAEALAHRGPDDSGVWVDPAGDVALGHRRLSILDLSPEGHQPMRSACGRYVIAFNGEIYNFQELREALGRVGGAPAWRGHSDTEVILASIRHWGLRRAIEDFVGMFAFALWDREERTLHLARDRLGEKPLYYGWMGDAFLFGSELKALRTHPAWRGDVDRGALALFMRHNYIPTPYSIYKGIFKLLPGTLLTLKAGRKEFEIEPYWQARLVVEAGAANPNAMDHTSTVEQLDGLLRRVVAGQMVADVPLGAFLSGGVDSSTVVALMQAQSSRPVKTFTIGFHEGEYNEAEYAKLVARRLGTEHTELYVTPQQAMDVIPRLPQLYDEPFADSSQIPTFLVAQLARQHVTVSLSGDGGDELFAGYNRYAFARGLWNKLRRVPTPMRTLGAASLRSLSPAAWTALLERTGRWLPRRLRYANLGDKLHKLADVLRERDPEALYHGLVSHWQDPGSVVIQGNEHATILTDRRQWAKLGDFTERMMYLDLVSYLPDDILVKVDRAAMGVSLETRVPFLDHRVVEFAWRLPLSLKVRRGQGKWLLRQVLYRYVPKALIERPKMGFGLPIDAWLRGPLRDWAEGLLAESRLRAEGFFRPAPIHRLWREHLSGQRNWQYLLWDVLMFQAWNETQQQL
jgi:asparagine synthase (glutamine-hydrolysing)